MAAREYFEMVSRAAAEVERCQREIGELADGVPPMGGGDGGHGSTQADPTYAAFVTREQLLADAHSRMDAAQEVIGEALALIDGLRRIFCRKADVLELRYIDLLPWAAVADQLGVARSTAFQWHADVMAFVDSTPRVYILGMRNGETIISCG